MIEARSELGEGLEDERAARQARVRDLEPGSSTLVAVEEQVEIDRPRSPARAVALAAEAPLDRRAAGRGARAASAPSRARRRRSESAAGRVAPRLGLEESATAGRAPISSAARRIVASRSPRFGAEPDVGARHGRSTVTALNSTVMPAGFTCGLRTRTRTAPARTARRAVGDRGRERLEQIEAASRPTAHARPRRPACSRPRPRAGRRRRAPLPPAPRRTGRAGRAAAPPPPRRGGRRHRSPRSST